MRRDSAVTHALAMLPNVFATSAFFSAFLMRLTSFGFSPRATSLRGSSASSLARARLTRGYLPSVNTSSLPSSGGVNFHCAEMTSVVREGTNRKPSPS